MRRVPDEAGLIDFLFVPEFRAFGGDRGPRGRVRGAARCSGGGYPVSPHRTGVWRALFEQQISRAL
jgi:hypothetical protein